MYTGVKINYSEDDLDETIHLIQKRKEDKKGRKALIIQKLLGILLMMLGIVSAIILDGDITVMFFCVLMGIVIIFSRKIWLI